MTNLLIPNWLIVVMAALLTCFGTYPGACSNLLEVDDHKTAHEHDKSLIPKLERLFQIETYRQKNNDSSECTFTGRERMLKCRKVVEFDHDGYHKTLNETRQLILERLKLDHEPNTTHVNRSSYEILDDFENFFGKSNTNSHTQQTKYDKQSSKAQTIKSMHESKKVYPCRSNHDAVCIDFEIPNEHMYRYVNENKQFEQAYSSAYLWLNLHFTIGSKRHSNATVKMKIENVNSPIDFVENYFKPGWNLIDIGEILGNTSSRTPVHTFAVRPCRPQYSIGIKNTDVNQNKSHVYVTSFDTKKPILTIDRVHDNDVDITTLGQRQKRSAHKTPTSKKVSIAELDAESKDTYQTNECRHKTSDEECCIASYYITFSQLKWAKWILSPSGYKANFCMGKCSPFNSFVNSSKNAQIKYIYNQNKIERSGNAAVNELSSCCHPTKMKSLTIRYIRGDGIAVTTVLPNMIVTECGCS